MCIRICCETNSCDMCILFKIDGAQNFARMSMYIEFVIQVPKQKNARVSFPVRMVIQKNESRDR